MSNFVDPVARKKALIDAAKARSAQAGASMQKVEKTKIEFIAPEKATNRIRIVFDNSGSMNSPILDKDKKQSTFIEEAKKGVVEFLRNCVPNKDAVAVHLLNNTAGYYSDVSLPALIENTTLETDLVSIASAVDTPAIQPTGGTPLFETLDAALNSNPNCNRIVAFSDGEASCYQEEQVYAKARAKKVPIDTVYFGSKDEDGYEMMKRIAEKTGGVCLAFDPSKGVNFAEAFKYLTPVKRLMLMNAEFKAKLERGEIK